MKNKYIIISLIVLAIGLQSCFVAKKYQESQIEIADKYRDVSTNDSTTLASMPWEQLFTDSYLQDLIHKALDNNLDYLMAIERVNAAEAYYKQGKMAYLPSLQLGVNGGSYQLSENSATGVASGGNGLNYENYQLTGSISWEADIWGKIRSSKRASQAKYLQSEASQRAVKSALVAHLTSAYFQLIALDAQVEVVKKTVSNRTEGLATMTSLKNAGQVTEAAVKQTEAQLYSTQILLLNLEKNVKLLENTISLLLGQHSGSIVRGKLEDQKVMAELKTGFPSQLLRNRPDVMFAEYGLMNAFELTNVAKSNFYPSLSISANGGLESIIFDNWFNSTSIFSNVIANISQPLFNKRSIRTRYEVAKAQQARHVIILKIQYSEPAKKYQMPYIATRQKERNMKFRSKNYRH
ncbi:outer membrane protein OprM precursor [Saccharicrinis fermentans DSM 9555 = JCM 21142]|uniref:Outer membrane protein OprM n=1 Tax=Saccharicrinis fermentans DSM 9555 = JCM 21142 TaxID=869213 RepID=W7YNP7_9BACT|nr:efflux transporter outer membrane subunit [Saccharicrinis fermentans]GAF04049.1 outer membrane protein OprM precursor [Saccharicrinis fermentans DSM 9555 = JCM 21142]